MAYAELYDQTVVVTTTWNEKELIRVVPGARWNAVERQWEMPIGWAQCVILRGVFKQQVTFGEKLLEWGWRELEQRVRPALELRLKTSLEQMLSELYNPKLYDFQKVGASFLNIAGDVLLADEMGTGKTIQVLTALDSQAIKDVLPAIVICPNSVKYNWARETRTWYPDAEPVIIDGSVAERRKLFTQHKNNAKALFIINIEATRIHSRLAPYGSIKLKRCRECDPKFGDENTKPAQCEVHVKELNEIPFKTVIFDEAHRIKEPKSKQTRAAWAIMHGKTVRRRWALTGTPLANHPGDLWSIMHGVAPYEYPTRSKFVDRYCLTAWNSYGGLDIVGVSPEHKDEFFKILDPRFRRMPKALVLTQLPAKVRQFRHVEMVPKQRKAYKEMEDTLITRLADGEILVAPNNLAAQTRLLQLSSSYCTIEDDPRADSGIRVTLCSPSPKVDELEEIIGDMSSRQLAACAESKQLIMLAAKRLDDLKISYGLITGDQNRWERDLALNKFQSGDIQTLLFTIQAGGTGLTMTASDTLVFLQRSWSMIANKQAEDRVHRIGSEIHETINIIDIITRGTVEERQILRLYDKLQRLEEITRDRVTLAQAGASTEHLDAEEARILGANLGVL